ncbi:ribonuclease P protein component [Amaricoccus sp.]|uniref:ribonuclease P protein component n=1 Tax=Amaricoccus sp. TaxID=1872485 RepID=UPI00261E9879|nr:ribonuclease P protein component [uncultured Amaricoccus sp.]
MAAVRTLTRRADFLAAARARRKSRPAFTLQARQRAPGELTAEKLTGEEPTGTSARVGFTCSKKVGNAVARNRAKRRLRAAARAVLASGARPGWDYVLIGRPGVTATHPFDQLCDDLRSALESVHA